MDHSTAHQMSSGSPEPQHDIEGLEKPSQEPTHQNVAKPLQVSADDSKEESLSERHILRLHHHLITHERPRNPRLRPEKWTVAFVLQEAACFIFFWGVILWILDWLILVVGEALYARGMMSSFAIELFKWGRHKYPFAATTAAVCLFVYYRFFRG